MKNKYDVVIVGAGPAGLRCAEVLAVAGKDVLVLEKNKVVGPKVCAGGLTLKDLDLGIPERLIQRKFKKVFVHSSLQTSEVKSDKPFIATILRKDLGQWMLKKARKAGVEIKTNSEVSRISKKFVVVNNKEIHFDYLIGADGSNSIVREFLGVKTEKVGQCFQYLFKGKFKDLEIFSDFNKFGHYVWIFPYKNYVSVGTGRDLSRDYNLGLSVSQIRDNFDKWCGERFGIKKSKFEAAIVNYDYRGFDFGNIFLVGDAAGFASGLTAEGIYAAIKSGEDVAKKIINPNYNCENINKILKIKKTEDDILKSLESNRLIGEIESEIANFLVKIRFIDNAVVKELFQ